MIICHFFNELIVFTINTTLAYRFFYWSHFHLYFPRVRFFKNNKYNSSCKLIFFSFLPLYKFHYYTIKSKNAIKIHFNITRHTKQFTDITIGTAMVKVKYIIFSLRIFITCSFQFKSKLITMPNYFSLLVSCMIMRKRFYNNNL